ncbi:Tol-Pal system beta propeller repeat protein TolB [Actinobacillus delphinicola]|uniref:Tol-Pal system protein TolB n=1 Tax=Actinobacillus delphinicola TaxID=51161 RepID=A0A448TUS6_9PAST|nr:translocation protein TolB [Actinobacillus delphinicola]
MKQLKQMIVTLFFGVLFLLQTAKAESEVRIVIDGGSVFARPIAVVPFHWNGQGSKPIDISSIVAADLTNSGMFQAYPTQSMPQQPNSATQVKPAEWAKLGIGNVVVGQITPNGNSYAVAFQLVDTLGVSGAAGRVLLQKQYLIPASKIRVGAHTISDAIFQQLTGVKGAFRTKIAYVIQENSGDRPYQLRVADYDGHNQHIIFRSAEPIMSPAWSADGRKMAYSSFENQQSRLIMQDLATGQRNVIVQGPGHHGAPSFSPDGTTLAFSSSKDGKLNIYLYNLSTHQITQLTQNAGNNTEPSWSADSQHIIFTSDRNGNPQVYMMNRDGSDVQQLTNQGLNYSGQLTSDGKNLIFISNDHLVKKNLETGTKQLLTTTFLDESPSLSPNDLMIIYSSTQGLGKVLQLVSADGHFKARLPSGDGQVKFPAWSPYLN